MYSLYYDMHIHTALSPCADDDMVPGDIVGMALVNNLDIIAITDHNSFGNAAAVIEAAEKAKHIYGRSKDLIVLPGAEITTAEEVHVLCLFDNIKSALVFEKELSVHYTQQENREEIFGRQLLLDSNDTVIDTVKSMLIAPTTITFDSLYALTQKHGGAFVPAHVDRTSFSVTSNLGFLPPDLNIPVVEFTSRSISGQSDVHDLLRFPGKKYIYSSDSHQLHTINENEHSIILPEISAKAIIDYLRF